MVESGAKEIGGYIYIYLHQFVVESGAKEIGTRNALLGELKEVH